MKILLYSSYYSPYISGITVYSKRIFEGLTKKYQTTVLTFLYKRDLPMFEIINGIKVFRMPFMFRVSKGFISFQSILYFIKGCMNNDLIFLNLPNVEGLPLALIAKIFRKKIVAIFYCEVKLGGGSVSRAVEFILEKAIYMQLLLSDRIIMLPGYKAQTKLAAVFSDKISTIFPPVYKLPVNKNTLLEIRNKYRGFYKVGFVGRIAKEKGIEYLISAAKQLAARGIKMVLLFAGPGGKDVVGESNYDSNISDLLNKCNIRYEKFGQLSEEELGALYEALDVLVLPSINKTEAFGMVQIEAMLAGTPVVASDIPGVRIPVKLTGMGELSKPGDFIDISAKIFKVLRHKDEYKSHQLIAIKEFKFNDIIEQYKKILTSIS